jgi:hypothetical protein
MLSFPGAENLVTNISGMLWMPYKNGNATEMYLEVPPNKTGTGINTKQKGMVPSCMTQDLLFTNILTKNQYTDCGFDSKTSPTNDYLIQFIDNSSGVAVAPPAQVWIRENHEKYLTSLDVQFVYFVKTPTTDQKLFQISSYYSDSTFNFTVSQCNDLLNMPFLALENGTCIGDPCSGEDMCTDIQYPFNLGTCIPPSCPNERS